MDEIVIHLRGDNEPPASAPTGGALSSAQYDASLSNLKTGVEQVYDETVHTEDMVEIDPENPDHLTTTLLPVSLFFVSNPDFDEEDPDSRAFLGITWEALQALLPDGGAMPAEDIRDALQTLDGPECLTAHKLSDLGDASVAALEARSGAARLSASALKDLPTLTPGDPVTVTHDGAGEDPVVGDTLTANFAAGWFGDVQWERDNTSISGATSPAYTLVEDDEGTYVAPAISNLGFVAQGFNAEGPSATVPEAFEAGDWTATAGVEQITVNITSLPGDGGSAITALQYRLDGGAWTNLSGTGTGSRNITGLTGGVEYDVQLRAVNAVGGGAASDTKSRTPTAASSGPEWVAVGAGENIFDAASSHPFPVPAGGAVGDMLILLINNWDTPTGVTTNTGQTLTQLGVYSSAGELCRVYGVVITGSVPTTITAEFGSSVQIAYQVAVARGVTAAGGLVNDGVQFSPFVSIPYTATVSSSLVLAMLSSQPNTSNLTAASINGADAAAVTDSWEDVLHVITGVNTSAAGSRNIGLTFSAAITSGRWFSLELVP